MYAFISSTSLLYALRFSLKVDDESFIENIPGSNSFSFKKAGTSKITAIYSDNTDLKADVTLTSEYLEHIHQ